MLDIEDYLAQMIHSLRQSFGERLLYVGLQGSYFRGEADAESDIDIMVVLDVLRIPDMDAYRAIIRRSVMPTGPAALSAAGRNLPHGPLRNLAAGS